MPTLRPVLLLALACAAAPLAAQTPAPALPADVAGDARVRAAMSWLDANFPAQVEEWVRITEIPAPSRQETARGALFRAGMDRLGLETSVDSIGNVIGVRRGAGGGPTLVLAGHLDTVHPAETDVRVRRAGDTLRAPGVFDNSASLANLLAMLRAMDAAGLRTRGDVIVIGTAQEELGLRGMEFWLERNPGVADLLVAVDGPLGPVAYGALGIYWTRYHFEGEGSHTNTSAGRPHPARALADAVRSIYELRVPEGRGGAVFNVGMLDGGLVFNAIPEAVSFTMDLRSVNPVLLDSLDGEIGRRVEAAAAAHGVRARREVVQRLRAAGTEAQLADRRAHPLVDAAVAAHRAVGLESEAVASGSTDANAAVVRGIPALSVGRSFGGAQHTLAEWAHVPSALPATRMLLLLTLSAAGLAP